MFSRCVGGGGLRRDFAELPSSATGAAPLSHSPPPPGAVLASLPSFSFGWCSGGRAASPRPCSASAAPRGLGGGIGGTGGTGDLLNGSPAPTPPPPVAAPLVDDEAAEEGNIDDDEDEGAAFPLPAGADPVAAITCASWNARRRWLAAPVSEGAGLEGKL